MAENFSLAIRKETGAAVFIAKDGSILKNCPEEGLLLVDKQDPYKLTSVSQQNGVTVVRMPAEKMLSTPKILSLLKLSVESFRIATGFAADDTDDLTIAVWMETKNGLPRGHEFLVGGKSFFVKFPMEAFRGYDDKSSGTPKTEIRAKVHPSEIKFKAGSNVSEWQLIQDRFRESLSSPGANIDWSETAGVYTRYLK